MASHPSYKAQKTSAGKSKNGADDESDSFADSYYSLRDEGRNPDGSGESMVKGIPNATRSLNSRRRNTLPPMQTNPTSHSPQCLSAGDASACPKV